MVSGQDQEEKHFHEKRVKLIIKIIIIFGTARGIAKSEIRKQQKRQGRDVRASIAEKINTYLRIYPSATQTQGKWKKNIMIFSAKTFFPSARRHQHYLFISLYFFCRILLHIKSGCNLSRKRPATPNCVRLHSHESHSCTNAKLIWKRFLPPPEPIYKWKAIKSLRRGFAS